MLDPLELFDWSSLHERYDGLCKRVDRHPHHLAALNPQPVGDRSLYFKLIEMLIPEAAAPRRISVGWWEAMLYWKLYSGRFVGNVRNYVPADAAARQGVQHRLDILGEALPPTIDASWSAVHAALRAIDKAKPLGMSGNDTYPMRTTFLHFMYPGVVPIFDVMVLRAVGVHEASANHSFQWLERYVPHVWNLAARHSTHISSSRLPETPIRAIEMGLWIVGHGNSEASGS